MTTTTVRLETMRGEFVTYADVIHLLMPTVLTWGPRTFVYHGRTFVLRDWALVPRYREAVALPVIDGDTPRDMPEADAERRADGPPMPRTLPGQTFAEMARVRWGAGGAGPDSGMVRVLIDGPPIDAEMIDRHLGVKARHLLPGEGLGGVSTEMSGEQTFDTPRGPRR